MKHNKHSLVRGSLIVILLLALFSIMSLTTSAHSQNRQIRQSDATTLGGNAPSGMADMHWDPQAKTLTATLHVSGLSPKSNHAAHVHTGSCSKEGHILYPFKNVVVDASGSGTTTTTINNVTGGIPASGWDVTVHRGATAGTGALLCGDIANPQQAASVSVPLHAM